MFDLFHFVADCRDALAADKSHKTNMCARWSRAPYSIRRR
jgi:hypothetical protein